LELKPVILIVVVPTPLAVITPSELTVAIDVSFELNSYASISSAFVITIFAVSPTSKL